MYQIPESPNPDLRPKLDLDIEARINAVVADFEAAQAIGFEFGGGVDPFAAGETGGASLSLNNDRHERHLLSTPGTSEDTGRDGHASSASSSDPVPDPSSFWCESWLKGEDPPDQKRSLLFSELRAQGYDPGPARFWPMIEAIKNEVANLAGFEDDFDDFENPSFERHNFMNCYSPKQVGMALQDDEGNWKVKKFSCGSKYCFWCRTKKRENWAAERFEIIRQAGEKGVERVWRLQATVPKNMSSYLLDDSKQLSKLRKEFAKKIRKAFGVKTESNMAMDAIFHPVGDKNLMEDHPHFHYIVYPLLLKKDKKGNIEEIPVNIEKLDLSFLRDAWNECLYKVYGVSFNANQPQVSYLQLNKKGESKQKTLKKIYHRLKYDSRSFAKDFEKQPVASVDGGVVIKGKTYRDGEPVEYWQGVSYADYAERWIHVCDNNSVTPYGWLHNFNKWVQEGVFKKAEKEADNIENYNTRETCEIHIVRGKVWDKEKKRVVWKREEWAYTRDSRQWLRIGKDAGWFIGDVGPGLKVIERV